MNSLSDFTVYGLMGLTDDQIEFGIVRLRLEGIHPDMVQWLQNERLRRVQEARRLQKARERTAKETV